MKTKFIVLILISIFLAFCTTETAEPLIDVVVTQELAVTDEPISTEAPTETSTEAPTETSTEAPSPTPTEVVTVREGFVAEFSVAFNPSTSIESSTRPYMHIVQTQESSTYEPEKARLFEEYLKYIRAGLNPGINEPLFFTGNGFDDITSLPVENMVLYKDQLQTLEQSGYTVIISAIHDGKLSTAGDVIGGGAKAKPVEGLPDRDDPGIFSVVLGAGAREREFIDFINNSESIQSFDYTKRVMIEIGTYPVQTKFVRTIDGPRQMLIIPPGISVKDFLYDLQSRGRLDHQLDNLIMRPLAVTSDMLEY